MRLHHKIIGFFKGLVSKDDTVVKQTVFDAVSEGRSAKWPECRKSFLKDHPKCEVCGGQTKLNVHHIIPFHVDQDKELDKDNLITLCDGSRGLNCHFWIGHNGNWRAWNGNVKEDAKLFGDILSKRLGVPW